MSGYHERDFEPFPVQNLKRVDHPTIAIDASSVKRFDARQTGFHKAYLGDYGPHLAREMRRFVPKHPVSGALYRMTSHLKDIVDGIVAVQKAPIPEDPPLLARHIKELAYFLRADVVGICELPSYAVYSHSFPKGEPITLNHKYAIGILVDQDWHTANISKGNDWISNSMSFMAYSTTAFISCIVADYIRSLGYPARAHHARNYQVAVPPILLWAGLGEASRMGECVLNPFLGPRFKAAVVTTDMPLTIDKPIDFGLQDFCKKCKKCARECPSGAITFDDKTMYNGYEHYRTDIDKCTAMRVGNKRGSGCGVCVKSCPWNKPWTTLHRGINWLMRHSPLARTLAIHGDDIFGYGKPHYEDKWWFDLEDVDGTLVVPKSTTKENQ